MISTSRKFTLHCATAAVALLGTTGAWAQESVPAAPSPFEAPQAVQAAPQGAQAPAPRRMPSGGDGLGDHIATRVLNMNGLNITNVNDPFFEGDAVNLGYFNENNGWDHVAKKDVDLAGFGLLNIGSLDLEDAGIEGGTLTDSRISAATISDSTVTNSIITRATIDNSEFTAPHLQRPTLEDGEASNLVVTGGAFTDLTVDGAEISGLSAVAPEFDGAILSGTTRIAGQIEFPDGMAFDLGQATADSLEVGALTVSETMDLGGNTLSGIGAAEGDTDAMSMGATREMIDARLAGFDGSAGLDEVQEALGALENRIADTAPVSEIERLEAALTEIESRIADRPANVSSWTDYRPTPKLADALGRLMGDDAMRAISNIDAMIYNLPDADGVAVGIDPESVPPELRFVVRKNGSDDINAELGVDYAQIIGPLVAAIQHLDARVTALETRKDQPN